MHSQILRNSTGDVVWHWNEHSPHGSTSAGHFCSQLKTCDTGSVQAASPNLIFGIFRFKKSGQQNTSWNLFFFLFIILLFVLFLHVWSNPVMEAVHKSRSLLMYLSPDDLATHVWFQSVFGVSYTTTCLTNCLPHDLTAWFLGVEDDGSSFFML